MKTSHSSRSSRFCIAKILALLALMLLPLRPTTALAGGGIADTQISTNFGAVFRSQVYPQGFGPFTFSASGLPAGLAIDSQTGIISGTLADAGDFPVALTAVGLSGTSTGHLYLHVRGRLNVVASSDHGTVSPGGQSFWDVGTSITLTALPKKGYFCSGWNRSSTLNSGTNFIVIGSFVNPVQISTGKDDTWTASFAPWKVIAGDYTGLIPGTDFVGTHAGILRLHITSLGSFSGSIEMDGLKSRFSGALDSSKAASIVIFRKNLSPLTLSLNSFYYTTATLFDGHSTQTIDLSLLAPFNQTSPCQETGYYTLALNPPGDAAFNDIPQGTGYATLKISSNGSARIVGVLPDATPFSFSGNVSRTQSLPIYLPMYKKAGLFFGNLHLGNSDLQACLLNGNLTWVKPAVVTKDVNVASFATTITAEGALYWPFHIRPGSRGEMDFSETWPDIYVPQSFSFNSLGKVVIDQPNPHGVTFSCNQKTGFFWGKFKDDSGTTHKYQGVLLNQQTIGGIPFPHSSGAGIFDKGTSTGSMKWYYYATDPQLPGNW